MIVTHQHLKLYTIIITHTYLKITVTSSIPLYYNELIEKIDNRKKIQGTTISISAKNKNNGHSIIFLHTSRTADVTTFYALYHVAKNRRSIIVWARENMNK